MAPQNDSEFTYHAVATDEDHYFLKANVEDDNVKTALVSAATATGKVTELSPELFKRKRYLYRKMSPVEAAKSIEHGKILYAVKPKRKPEIGEKWMSETLDHTNKFSNKDFPGATTVVEYEFPEKGYIDDIGGPDATIPQKGSGEFNSGNPTPKNITHRERLPANHPKQNIGLKGKYNIDRANQHLISVRKINPASRMNKYKLGRWMRRNGLKAAKGALALVGIAMDGAQLIIAMINDKGIGRQTAVTLSEIVGSAAGASAASTAIGAAMGSFLPGIGNIIGAIIGGIIGGFTAATLTNYIFGFFTTPAPAPGPGAPALATDPFPDIFNIPPLDVDVSTATGAPALNVDISSSFNVPNLGLNASSNFPNMNTDNSSSFDDPDIGLDVSNDYPGLGFNLQNN